MPKKKKPGYPDKTHSLDHLLQLCEPPNDDRFKDRPNEWVNEFFLIEALLCSDKAKKAFQGRGKLGLLRFFLDHRIVAHDPLEDSHHKLLTAPVQDLEVNPNFGVVDMRLGIQDLGALARLTPDAVRTMTRGTMEWPTYDGEQAVLSLLQNPSPRFVCLRFDTSHHADTILKSKKLKRLLQERYEQSETLQPPVSRLVRSPASGVDEPEIVSEGPFFAFSNRQMKWTPFKNIPSWLRNLKCYRMMKGGCGREEISGTVYPNVNNGLQHYDQAIPKVRAAIESAENGTWPPFASRRNS